MSDNIFRGDHTEAIEIHYDPENIKYEDLLHLFWNNHEYGLTTKIKIQYASRIFYHSEEQKKIAEGKHKIKTYFNYFLINFVPQKAEKKRRKFAQMKQS